MSEYEVPRPIIVSHGYFNVATILLIFILRMEQQNVTGATLVARWEFEDDWQCSNDLSFNLNPSGPVNLTNIDCRSVADFHGGILTDMDSPLLSYADSTAQPTSASFNSGLSVMGWFYVRAQMGLLFSHMIEVPPGFLTWASASQPIPLPEHKYF
jgi:hypothetical protein